MATNTKTFLWDMELFGPLNIEVDFNFTPEDPGFISGPPDICRPPEPAEIEVTAIRILGTTRMQGTKIVDAKLPAPIDLSPLLRIHDIYDNITGALMDMYEAGAFNEGE